MSDLKMTNAGDYMSEVDEEGKWKAGSTNLHIQSESVSKMPEPWWVLRIPKPVGYWCIGGNFQIGVPSEKKPTQEQIKNTEQMFGCEWKDYE